MKNAKLKIVVPALVLSFFFLTGAAYAQTPTPAPHVGFFGGLVQFFETRFGLNKTQVQAAVKDYKTQWKTTPHPSWSPQQIADREKTRLDALVKAGKITNEQETAIIHEVSSLRSKYNLGNLSGMTPDQKKTTLTNYMSDLKNWAQSQNIPLQYVVAGPVMGRGMGRGIRFGWRHMHITPTPTPGA